MCACVRACVCVKVCMCVFILTWCICTYYDICWCTCVHAVQEDTNMDSWSVLNCFSLPTFVKAVAVLKKKLAKRVSVWNVWKPCHRLVRCTFSEGPWPRKMRPPRIGRIERKVLPLVSLVFVYFKFASRQIITFTRNQKQKRQENTNKVIDVPSCPSALPSEHLPVGLAPLAP